MKGSKEIRSRRKLLLAEAHFEEPNVETKHKFLTCNFSSSLYYTNLHSSFIDYDSLKEERIQTQ